MLGGVDDTAPPLLLRTHHPTLTPGKTRIDIRRAVPCLLSQIEPEQGALYESRELHHLCRREVLTPDSVRLLPVFPRVFF
jgi:hypothetical protein